MILLSWGCGNEDVSSQWIITFIENQKKLKPSLTVSYNISLLVRICLLFIVRRTTSLISLYVLNFTSKQTIILFCVLIFFFFFLFKSLNKGNNYVICVYNSRFKIPRLIRFIHRIQELNIFPFMRYRLNKINIFTRGRVFFLILRWASGPIQRFFKWTSHNTLAIKNVHEGVPSVCPFMRCHYSK